jgi:hypothetical protein
MNRILITLVSGILLTTACGDQTPKEDTALAGQNTGSKNMQTMNFDELFTGISPEEITGNIFKLVGKDYTVIIAGKESHFNSMTAN